MAASKQISMRVTDDELYDAFERKCNENGMSKTDVISGLMRLYVDGVVSMSVEVKRDFKFNFAKETILKNM